MGINTDYVGRTYPPREVYQVSRVKIGEFAAATGATSALHTDVDAARAAGYADVIAPPTFAVVIAQRAEGAYLADPEARVDFSRVVHAAQAFAHTRPLVAGDQIQAHVSVDSIVARSTIAMVTTRTELTCVTGEHVATVTSTLAVRGD